MKITMKDIAKRLNVSINAVSIALNDKPGVSDEMRLQILRTADEMGYINQKKQYLSIFSKSNICVLMQSYYANTGHFYSIVLCSIVEQAKNFGYFSILNYFEDDVFYQGWIEEGITIETMKLFNIKWYEGQKHIIIPHYNVEDKLIGIRRRSLQEQDKDNKYMPEIIEGVQYTHSLNFNLYGLNKHIVGIKKTKKIVIVESEKSVMLAHDYYGEDAFVVATCGFNISNWQRDMILSLGVEEVMLGYDKDFIPTDFENSGENDLEYKKYQRYVTRLYSLAYKFVAYCRTYILWDFDSLLQKKDSPFDRGKEVLEKIMKDKILVSTEREGDI